jgi:hypothetical protein
MIWISKYAIEQLDELPHRQARALAIAINAIGPDCGGRPIPIYPYKEDYQVMSSSDPDAPFIVYRIMEDGDWRVCFLITQENYAANKFAHDSSIADTPLARLVTEVMIAASRIGT